jgi:hypothetical protein
MSAVTPQVANAPRAKTEHRARTDLQAIANGLRMTDPITTLHTYPAAYGTDITRIGSGARRYDDWPSIETAGGRRSIHHCSTCDALDDGTRLYDVAGGSMR